MLVPPTCLAELESFLEEKGLSSGSKPGSRGVVPNAFDGSSAAVGSLGVWD